VRAPAPRGERSRSKRAALATPKIEDLLRAWARSRSLVAALLGMTVLSPDGIRDLDPRNTTYFPLSYCCTDGYRRRRSGITALLLSTWTPSARQSKHHRRRSMARVACRRPRRHRRRWSSLARAGCLTTHCPGGGGWRRGRRRRASTAGRWEYA